MSDATMKHLLQILMGNGAWLGLYVIAFVLALVLPRLRGRGWLFGATAPLVALQTWHTLGQIVLLADGDKTYRAIWNPAWPLTATINAAASACLIFFLYAQRTATNDRMTPGEILFPFRGRIARRHFWLGSLSIAFVGWVPTPAMLAGHGGTSQQVATVAYALFCLAAVWPTLALQVKRWHDRGKSGWMVMISFIPIVGPIWAFIETGCLPGTRGPNAYGEDPLAVAPTQAQAPLVAPPAPVVASDQAWRSPDFQ